MTDKEFFIQNGYSEEGDRLVKRFIDSAMQAFVSITFNGFNVEARVGILYKGAMFDGTITHFCHTKESSVKWANEFAERMKI